MQRRVIQKFVAGPCLRDFMEQRQLWNEPLAAALLFSRAKIIFFWAEFSSLIDWSQTIAYWGAKSKIMAASDDSF